MNAARVADEMMAFPSITAAAVAGISERRLNEWAKRDLVKPSLIRSMGNDRYVCIYGFKDLVELLVVRQLEQTGVHIRVIGSVVDFIRERGHDLPEIRFAVGDVARNEIYFITNSRTAVGMTASGHVRLSWSGRSISNTSASRSARPADAATENQGRSSVSGANSAANRYSRVRECRWQQSRNICGQVTAWNASFRPSLN